MGDAKMADVTDFKCDVCNDNKRIRLPTMRRLECTASQLDDTPISATDPGWKEFDCPQCVPLVPYRRVRALSLVTKYPADDFGKYQMPIERSLAARFGEYLLREGLLRFVHSGSADMGTPSDKITVTARLGVVSREDTLKSGAVPEVALAVSPKIPQKLTRQERDRLDRISPRAVAWKPPPLPGERSEDVITDEFDEPKTALANRFSGLEI